MSKSNRKWHVDGTLPQEGEIFVFGSNHAGRHGAGAAKVACGRFGAKLGVGLGQEGNSYAIPTKDEKLKTLPLNEICIYVYNFFLHAARSEREFFVTRIGCGLAGYKDQDIAPMFMDAPPNCNLPEDWRKYENDTVWLYLR